MKGLILIRLVNCELQTFLDTFWNIKDMGVLVQESQVAFKYMHLVFDVLQPNMEHSVHFIYVQLLIFQLW